MFTRRIIHREFIFEGCKIVELSQFPEDIRAIIQKEIESATEGKQIPPELVHAAVDLCFKFYRKGFLDCCFWLEGITKDLKNIMNGKTDR